MPPININDIRSKPNLSGRNLIKNTLFNLFGHALPMVVAFFAIPFIIEGLGTERFGVLTLAWMMVGYFSLFDMGLGRATTKFVAEYSLDDDQIHLIKIIRASVFMILFFSIIAVIISWLLTPLLVNKILNIEPSIINEAKNAFYLLAFSVPIVLGTTTMRGILEARQEFKIINAIKIPTYIAAFVTPLLVLPFTKNLLPVVSLLVASRLIALIIYTIYVVKVIPGVVSFKLPEKNYFKKLITYGGWLTISNIIWPVMTYLDRFLIGAILTMTMVSYYVTPYELVSKLLVISGSFLSVIFPAFSAMAVEKYNELMKLQENAVKYLLLTLVPVIFFIIAWAYPFLKLWLNEEFAQNSSFILQLLSLGILINSVSQVYSSAIQAMNRPDLTAKLHLIELPFYLGLLWYAIHSFGIVGAALVWVGRIVIDSGLYYYLFYRLIPLAKTDHRHPQPALLVWSVLLIVSGFALSNISNILLSGVIGFLILVTALAFAWKMLLSDEEQHYLLNFGKQQTGEQV